MAVSRRQVLRFGLFGATALALGGVGLALQSTVPREPKAPLRTLSAREYAILVALAARMVPSTDGSPDPTELDVAGRIDAFLATCDPGLQGDVKQVLALMENGLSNLVFGLTPRPFSASTPEVQEALLQGWRTSHLDIRRTAYKAINGLVAATYYGAVETYASVGYPGPPNYGNTEVTP